jgi:hypothetical protein
MGCKTALTRKKSWRTSLKMGKSCSKKSSGILGIRNRVGDDGS